MTLKGQKISPEAAAREIDFFIERRSKQRDDANWAARQWAESAKRYNLREASERRRAWVIFHRRLQVLHAGLSDEHRRQADALIEANGGQGKEKTR